MKPTLNLDSIKAILESIDACFCKEQIRCPHCIEFSKYSECVELLKRVPYTGYGLNNHKIMIEYPRLCYNKAIERLKRIRYKRRNADAEHCTVTIDRPQYNLSAKYQVLG